MSDVHWNMVRTPWAEKQTAEPAVCQQQEAGTRAGPRVVRFDGGAPSGPGGSAKLLKTRDLNCMQGCGLQQS